MIGRKIRTIEELKTLFTMLVAAVAKMNSAAQDRDQKKQAADADYETETKTPRGQIEAEEPVVQDYCAKHRSELLPEGKKSGIVGPVTIEFRLTPPVLANKKDGGKIDPETVIAKIRTVAEKAEPADRRVLMACIIEKPSVDQAAVKKLPETLLKKLGLELTQEEKFSWKPNAER